MSTVRLAPSGATIEIGDDVFMFPCKGVYLSRKIMNKTNVIGHREYGYLVFYDVTVSWADTKGEDNPFESSPLNPEIKMVYIHCSSQDNLPPFGWLAK